MRVEQSGASFNPVTITLDSQHEVDTFNELLNTAYNNSSSGSSVERLADEMRNKIQSGGWLASDMSC